jgi:hypothetical protein
MDFDALTQTGIIDPNDRSLSPGIRTWLDEFERVCRETEKELDIEMPPAPNGDVLDAEMLDFDPNWDRLTTDDLRRAISPPSRGRGLKQVLLPAFRYTGHIAPFTGARIETTGSR